MTNTLETRWDLSGCLQLSIFLLLLCLWTVVGRRWSVVEALCCKTTRGQCWSAETLLSQMAREVPRAWPRLHSGPPTWPTTPRKWNEPWPRCESPVTTCYSQTSDEELWDKSPVEVNTWTMDFEYILIRAISWVWAELDMCHFVLYPNMWNLWAITAHHMRNWLIQIILTGYFIKTCQK